VRGRLGYVAKAQQPMIAAAIREIFPNDAALIRLAGAMLIEQNDESARRPPLPASTRQAAREVAAARRWP